MPGRPLRRARALVLGATLALGAITALHGCALSRTPFTAKRARPKPKPAAPLAPEETAEDVARREALAAADPAVVIEDVPTRRRHTFRAIPRSDQDLGRPPLPVEAERPAKLAAAIGATGAALDEPCLAERCASAALDRVAARLSSLERSGEGNVRVLHLGDALVAADSVALTARRWLQYRFGAAGRGLVALDQRAEDGGRVLSYAGFGVVRAADLGREGERFGFVGAALEAREAGAKLVLALDEDDADLVLHFDAHPAGGRLDVMYEGVVLAELDTASASPAVRARRFRLPAITTRARTNELVLVAKGPGVRLLAASFEARRPGVLYDAVSPAGAGAGLYAAMDQDALREHLRALAPDLVIIAVGSADAAALAKGTRTLDEVRADHEKLLVAVRDALPESDCMVWTPLEALEEGAAGLVPRATHAELRGLQRALAARTGCATWDVPSAMGGDGAVRRWHEAGLMNDDLATPKLLGGEVLGHLFATSLLAAYAGE